MCRVLGSESKLSQTNACSSALSRGASQIPAREGKGHSSERMTAFSPKAASFRAVAPPAPAQQRLGPALGMLVQGPSPPSSVAGTQGWKLERRERPGCRMSLRAAAQEAAPHPAWFPRPPPSAGRAGGQAGTGTRSMSWGRGQREGCRLLCPSLSW